MKIHQKIVCSLQEEMRRLLKVKSPNQLLALKYSKGYSNTTRSKSYKKNCFYLNCGPLNRILSIDTAKKSVIAEPRVTMEKLVNTLATYGFTVPVVPEFKGITVGGAIMGAAAESSSHLYGAFNDCCLAYEILCGNGDVIRVTSENNSALFYGLPGSYGSLGALLSAEIKLIPINDFVKIKKHILKPFEAIKKIRELSHLKDPPEFVDGVVFSKDLAVVVEGKSTSKEECANIPSISTMSFYSKWFSEYLFDRSKMNVHEEKIEFKDYLFRYDRGAFWMGGYLFNTSLIYKLITEGIYKYSTPLQNFFNEKETFSYRNLNNLHPLKRTLLNPLMTSQKLWSILHKAEKWVQERFVIQDFCISETNIEMFMANVIEKGCIFPLWLCPIKGADKKQIFSPHQIHDGKGFIINLGVYGIPGKSQPVSELTKFLEKHTFLSNGRKVLYSRSYYSQEEFWTIYPHKEYQRLRQMTSSSNIWHEITDKVLSE